MIKKEKIVGLVTFQQRKSSFLVLIDSIQQEEFNDRCLKS